MCVSADVSETFSTCVQQQRVPLRWYPPEYFKSHFYGFKGDVWAFGIVLWEMQTFGEWEARGGAGNPQTWVTMCGQESVFDLFTTGVACLPDEAADFSLAEIKQPWLNVSVSGTLPYPNLETSEAVVYHISIGHKNKNPEGCRPEM